MKGMGVGPVREGQQDCPQDDADHRQGARADCCILAAPCHGLNPCRQSRPWTVTMVGVCRLWSDALLCLSIAACSGTSSCLLTLSAARRGSSQSSTLILRELSDLLQSKFKRRQVFRLYAARGLNMNDLASEGLQACLWMLFISDAQGTATVSMTCPTAGLDKCKLISMSYPRQQMVIRKSHAALSCCLAATCVGSGSLSPTTSQWDPGPCNWEAHRETKICTETIWHMPSHLSACCQARLPGSWQPWVLMVKAADSRDSLQ